MRRTRWAAVAGTALAAVLLSGCLPTPDRPPSPTTGPATSAPADLGEALAPCPVPDSGEPGALPALTLTCLGGEGEVALERLRGPLVINVWASWCGPCRQEAPFLAEVSEAYAGEVTFLGVIVEDEPRLATEFAQMAGWEYAHMLDPDGAFLAELGRAGVPQTIVVDADGQIATIHPGPVTSAEQLRDLVAEGR